jgi:hypothetical protein
MFHTAINGFKANGRKTSTATIHLQKARLIGGMLSFKPRAIMKFTDQIAFAPMANRLP